MFFHHLIVFFIKKIIDGERVTKKDELIKNFLIA